MIRNRRQRGRAPRWIFFIVFLGIGFGTGFATRRLEVDEESTLSRYIATNLWERKAKRTVEIPRVAVRVDPLNVPETHRAPEPGTGEGQPGGATGGKTDPGPVVASVPHPADGPPPVVAPPPDDEPKARAFLQSGGDAVDALQFAKATGLYKQAMSLKVSSGTLDEAAGRLDEASKLEGLYRLISQTPVGNLSGWVEVEIRGSGRITGRLVGETGDYVEVERTSGGGVSRLKIPKGHYDRLTLVSAQERGTALERELERKEKDAARSRSGKNYALLAASCQENGLIKPMGRLMREAVKLDPNVRKAYYEHLANQVFIVGYYYYTLQDFAKARREWDRLKKDFPESDLLSEVEYLVTGKKPVTVAALPETKEPSPPLGSPDPVEPVGPPPEETRDPSPGEPSPVGQGDPEEPFDPLEPGGGTVRPPRSGGHASSGMDEGDQKVAEALGIKIIKYTPTEATAEADKAFETGRDILRSNPPGTGGFQGALKQAKGHMENARSLYQQALSGGGNRTQIEARLSDIQRTIYMIKKSSNIW